MACSSCYVCSRIQVPASTSTRKRRDILLCRVSSGKKTGTVVDEEKTQPKKIVDTRIHWSSPDEGWIDFDNVPPKEEEKQAESPSVSFTSTAGTHYEFLGVTRAAEVDEIRSAYRRLSKLYHPDTTSLPLDVAEKKFFRLKEAHSTLTSPEGKKKYDETLDKTFSNSNFGGPVPIWPYEVDPSTATRRSEAGKTSPVPKVVRQKKDDRYMHPVDRLDGRNMPLSDQAQTAVAFDLIAILFSVFVIIYIGVFKHGFDQPFPGKL